MDRVADDDGVGTGVNTGDLSFTCKYMYTYQPHNLNHHQHRFRNVSYQWNSKSCEKKTLRFSSTKTIFSLLFSINTFKKGRHQITNTKKPEQKSKIQGKEHKCEFGFAIPKVRYSKCPLFPLSLTPTLTLTLNLT